eukprot:scaffold12950_cov169-Skeletonema_marinoi.AAC.7
MGKYDDKDWAELPAEVQQAAAALGYNKSLWDKDDEPDACDEYWKDLTPAQQQAATVLGYNKKSWDKS